MKIFACIALIVTSVLLLRTVHQTEALDVRINNMEKAIAEEKLHIQTLRAEWAYVSRPERIKQLSQRFLPHMGELAGTQLLSLPGNSARIAEAVFSATSSPHLASDGVRVPPQAQSPVLPLSMGASRKPELLQQKSRYAGSVGQTGTSK